MDTTTTGHSTRPSKSIKEATIFELVCEIFRRWYSYIRRAWRRYVRDIVCENLGIPRTSSVMRRVSEPLIYSDQHETETKKLWTEISNYEKRLQELNIEIEQWKKSAAESEERLQELNIEVEKWKKSAAKSEERLQELNSEIEQWKQSAAKSEERSNKAIREMQEMKKSKDDALSRLSEMMGVKLRDNNPAITDLNDPNRPMKLGEQINELYENEWTEAFLNLKDANAGNEENIIKILLNIIKDINNQCIATSSTQLSGILELLLLKDLSKDDISDLLKSVKDARKSNAEKCVPLLYKQITGENTTASQYIEHCQPYIEKCVRICYIASVQDPPVYLHFEPGLRGEKYDKQIFKEFTESGIKVKFLVWPAMFLCQGGPLLSKGVVQPLNEKDETD